MWNGVVGAIPQTGTHGLGNTESDVPAAASGGGSIGGSSADASRVHVVGESGATAHENNAGIVEEPPLEEGLGERSNLEVKMTKNLKLNNTKIYDGVYGGVFKLEKPLRQADDYDGMEITGGSEAFEIEDNSDV